MAKEYWTITEVVKIFRIDERFLSNLEEEEIVCPMCPDNTSDKLFSESEMEKVRLAKILVEDMDINLPGVEVILRMRQGMIEMRRQFDAVLEDLARHLRESSR